MKIQSKHLMEFKKYLENEERTKNTIEKYVRDVCLFLNFAKTGLLKRKCNEYRFNDMLNNEAYICINKDDVLEYKRVIGNKYAITSANSMIASVNTFLKFVNCADYTVKQYRLQTKTYCDESVELTKSDYEKLICEAEKNSKNKMVSLIMQTICSSGIRVSELEYVTVEAAKRCESIITCKGKVRKIFLVQRLCTRLLDYAKANNIESGPIFITRNGKPIDRSNIWRLMKKICRKAGVEEKKVFPHNLRHLFARTFYDIEKDIAKLADILGHSNITFNGDDDLWIFVDGKLVLDVGGCHGQVKGVINFATGQVTYYNSAYNSVVVPNYTATKVPSNQRSYNMNEKDGYESIISSGTHKLQIFYLERAAGASNLTLEFNLPIIPKGSVYVSKDVEYNVAEKDLNQNNNVSPDETLELEANGATIEEFQKDDFAGRLYDFQVMYTTEATVPSWEMGASGVITSSLEYVLYQTGDINNQTGKIFTSSDGRLSIPAGYTAVISVPEAHTDGKPIKHINVSELGGTLSNKAYENLPGNYTYNNTEVQYKASFEEEFQTKVASMDLSKNKTIAHSTPYESPMYFNFINKYTWNIDFGTQSDTEISKGDKSTTLDIDEDVKVTFENELGEENWLDGEGSVDNDYGTKTPVQYPPKSEN